MSGYQGSHSRCILSELMNGCSPFSLAYAELYLTLGHLLRQFDLELYQTTKEDMEWKDFAVPVTRGSLKVLVRESQS